MIRFETLKWYYWHVFQHCAHILWICACSCRCGDLA